MQELVGVSPSLTRHLLVLGTAAAFVVAACSSAEGDPNTGGGGEGAGSDGGGGSPAGVGGAPTGGEGGQIPSDQVTTPEQCEYLGAGGADYRYCDYISADFSQPVTVTGLVLEVTTDLGDTLMLGADPNDEPRLELKLDRAETMATGFAIVRGIQMPHYTPTTVNVLATLDNQTIADTSFSPTYSCVEVTGDDWCWMGDPETITVTVP